MSSLLSELKLTGTDAHYLFHVCFAKKGVVNAVLQQGGHAALDRHIT